MFPWVRRVVMPRVAAASCGVMSDANWCDFALALVLWVMREPCRFDFEVEKIPV